jgi:hypothetical protein
MGDADIEVLRLSFDAFNRGDDAYLEVWDPDAELYDLPEIFDAPPVYRGREGIRHWHSRLRDRRIVRSRAFLHEEQALAAANSGAVSRPG